MNEIDLYKRVVDDCDDALKEAFIRRMNIADKIAETKLSNGMNISSSQTDEMHVQNVARDVPVELRPMALSLWRSLARMNRGRQYSYFVKKYKDYKLSFDSALTSELTDSEVYCTLDIAPVIENRLMLKTKVCPSSKDAINRLSVGEAKLAAVKTNGFYDTSWLYSLMLDKNLYVNRFEIMNNGDLVAIISKDLVANEENTIITVAFSITMTQPGDMAQKISVFAEAGLNIEYLTVKTQNIDVDDSNNINIVFVELSGNNINNPDVRAAFLQLEKECELFKVLGCRKSVL